MVAAEFDAIVIGGGPAGATAAILLAQSGWSVAVIEQAQFPRRKVCGECISASALLILRVLGVEEREWQVVAGPPLQYVALYSGAVRVEASLPPLGLDSLRWGHALRREHLDTLLLRHARTHGVTVWQPWRVRSVWRGARIIHCTATSEGSDATINLRAPVVIAAHGSWQPGTLPTQPQRTAPHNADLFAFKANFRGTALREGLLPVLGFSGGYGGMVRADGDRVTLAFCVRRDTLRQARQRFSGHSAAGAAFEHVLRSCFGATEALNQATQEGVWLSCGPIRPSFRGHWRDGVWLVGNAACEAHPIIGEGISMAMQSAWLLCKRLVAQREAVLNGKGWQVVGGDYAQAWHYHFATRLRIAAGLAHLAMRPRMAKIVLPAFKHHPSLLTLCARVAGKAHALATLLGGELKWVRV